MAHHGENPLGLSNEELKKMFERNESDVFRKNMPAEQAERINDILKNDPLGDQLGSTGRFTDGKLNEDDKGEIMIGVTSIEDRVVINFGKPVHWVGLTREQALGIANSLTKHAAGIPVKK